MNFHEQVLLWKTTRLSISLSRELITGTSFKTAKYYMNDREVCIYFRLTSADLEVKKLLIFLVNLLITVRNVSVFKHLRCFSTIASLFSSASGFNSLRLFFSSQISSSIALKNLNTSTEDKLPC
ncbi:hypothetical protein T08_7277 [Trichinella sp. T8]|nr:hypothetical protein T08_7277 [Trichinella sp. T8]